MTEQPPKTNLKPKAQADLEARRARQAQALRDNLKRRKAQARERAEDKPAATDTQEPG